MIILETMTFRKFIEEKYDIKDRVEQLKSDPIKDFINSDIFPYDFIDTENGELVKMLYYDEGKKEIAVLDLLAYTREDLIKVSNKDLLSLYDNYTEQFDFDGTLDLDKLSKLREASIKRNNDLGI